MRIIDADRFDVFFAEAPDGVDPEGFMEGANYVLERIDEAPTVEAEHARHGKWIKDKYGRTCCSVCYNDIPYVVVSPATYDDPYVDYEEIEPTDYCPHCGAYMREVEHD